MNKGHIKFGEVVNLENLNSDLNPEVTHALIRSESMEVIRMVLPRGKEIAEHSVKGELTIQCLKGEVVFDVGGKEQILQEKDWLALKKGARHALKVKEDAILLLIILFNV